MEVCSLAHRDRRCEWQTWDLVQSNPYSLYHFSLHQASYCLRSFWKETNTRKFNVLRVIYIKVLLWRRYNCSISGNMTISVMGPRTDVWTIHRCLPLTSFTFCSSDRSPSCWFPNHTIVVANEIFFFLFCKLWNIIQMCKKGWWGLWQILIVLNFLAVSQIFPILSTSELMVKVYF